MKYFCILLLLCSSIGADPEEIISRLKQDKYALSMFKTHFDRMQDEYRPVNHETNKLYIFFAQKAREIEEGVWDTSADRKKITEWFKILRETPAYREQYKNVIVAAEGLQQAIKLYLEHDVSKETIRAATKSFNSEQLQLRAHQGRKYQEICVERKYITPFLGHGIEQVKKWYEENAEFNVEDRHIVADLFAGKILQFQLVQEIRDLAWVLCPIFEKAEHDEQEKTLISLIESECPDLKNSYDVDYKPWDKVLKSSNT